MKIILSKKWCHEIKTLFGIEAICIILCVFSFIKDVVLMLFLTMAIVIIMTVVQIILFCSSYRFLTYTIDKNNFYESYLFRKRLCIIDKTKPIYYVIFRANEGMFSKKEYIVLSNESFKYQSRHSIRIFPWDKKTLLVSYDVKKQIAMPYDKQTKSILETDKWHSVV